ncbi:hypothetical protein COP2_043120 [Malus domestica]
MNINSVLSGGPHFQRSESIDRKSYLRLSALLMSFSSNNICMSGSSIMDGSSAVQLNSQHPQNSKKVKQKSMTQEPTAARGIECYIPTFQTGQVSLPIGPIIDDVNSMKDLLDFCRRTKLGQLTVFLMIYLLGELVLIIAESMKSILDMPLQPSSRCKRCRKWIN